MEQVLQSEGSGEFGSGGSGTDCGGFAEPMVAEWVPSRGTSTATPFNVAYRVGRFAHLVPGARWLDVGCADGGYAAELLAKGASEVIGIDVEPDRVAAATARRLSQTRFESFDGRHIPFPDASFDRALMNEVLEHVVDEPQILAELRRVLKKQSKLVLISPNRWFPFEGHGIHIGSWWSHAPAPFVPWLPKRLTKSIIEARNYWPREMVTLVRDAGFRVDYLGFVWPVLEQYPWMPASAIGLYRRLLPRLDDVRGLRRFGVSTLLIAS